MDTSSERAVTTPIRDAASLTQSFGAEATASWAAYRENGRHLTGQEVAAWLDNWGSDREGEPPHCHA